MTQCHIKDVPYDKHDASLSLKNQQRVAWCHMRALVGSKKMQQNVNNDDFLI